MIQIGDATHILKIVIQVVDQATASTKVVDKTLKSIEKTTAGINKKFSTFDARLLSLLFGGMALKKAFGGMLRSITNTFLKAEDGSSGLSKATTRLHASWEFLKFSIFDALNTPFFINMIDGIVGFINWLSQLDSAWKITFLAVSGGLFLIGTGLMIIGQFQLFWNAVFGMGGFLNNVNKINDKTLGTNGVFTKLRNWATVGLSIKALFDVNKYLQGEIGFRQLVDSLGTDLALIGLVSGKPWVIAIGVVLKLIPFGEQIADFGKTLTGRGVDRISKAFGEGDAGKGDPGQSLKNVVGLLTGSIEAGAGFAVTGLGTLLEFTDVYAQNVEASATKTDTYATSLKDLTPEIDSVINKIDGEEQSLNSSLKNTGTEMDIVSGVKTDEFIVSSNSRITQLSSEISKMSEWEDKWKSFGKSKDDFESSSFDRETSSVSD